MVNYDELRNTIHRIANEYQLTEFTFDTECIYNEADLGYLLEGIIRQTLSEIGIEISMAHLPNEQRYVATLSHGEKTMQVYADDYSDWLPDEFFMQLESIPDVFETALKYYSINPAIGLTGQDCWYFCGTETALKAARNKGIPLVYPGENPMEAPEVKKFSE